MKIDTSLFCDKESLPTYLFSEKFDGDNDEHAVKSTTKKVKINFIMELQLFGINHKTSKLSERELFIINDSNKDDFKIFFIDEFGEFVESFFALSTCNRTEIYFYGHTQQQPFQ